MKHLKLLDSLHREIQQVILSRQHPISGLLPASTSINVHGNYHDAWVRDNVYSIICVWALGLGYRRAGELQKFDLLSQSTIKLMRGLLQSMMRQSNKVEAFKYSLAPEDALHAKYDTVSGLEVVADDAWGHLQIDATSLYLLMLAQISASGLRVIVTSSEADFVQNLVYYISSAYRTPDYGIWERGNKINNGHTEINASSVGMAKAALQALDGFNLFGPNGDKSGVIQVIPDSISLARSTLASILPRESISKEVDSALLSIISFPAFAVGQEALQNKTRDNVLHKLAGRYGCKRFLLDGHQTVLEDLTRIYYEHSELVNFEHIECEWPLFYCYLYLGALFDGREVIAQHYRAQLQSLMVKQNGIDLLPELYIVPKENIAAEKQSPGSQTRIANDNLPLVWAQSLYYTGIMLDEGLLKTDDIDPLKMRRRSTRFVKTQLALVVLTSSEQVKNKLAHHGVIAESLQDIKPISIISATTLSDVYAHVGENTSLGLSGRPKRRIQSLTTSQTYDINNKVYLALSSMQSQPDSYRQYDAVFLSELITQEITHLYKHWLSQQVGIFTFMVDEQLANIPHAKLMFETLRRLQLRETFEYVGYASAGLAYRASLVNALTLPYYKSSPLPEEIFHEEIIFESKNLIASAAKILDRLDTESEVTTYRRIIELTEAKSLDDNIGLADQNITLRDFIKKIYLRAKQLNHWLVSRVCFSLLGYIPEDSSEALTVMESRSFYISIDSKTNNKNFGPSFNNTLFFSDIEKVFTDPLERTIALELLSALGYLARTNAGLFDGMRSIQLQNFMMLHALEKGDADDVTIFEWIALQPPSVIFAKTRSILSSHKHSFSQGIQHIAPFQHYREIGLHGSNLAHAVDPAWIEWRTARGLMSHFDNAFLLSIWQSLMFADYLVFGDIDSKDAVLDCKLTRSSMTSNETSFGYLMDELTELLHPAYYKTAVIEALYAYTQFCKENPQVRFQNPLVFSEVLEDAAEKFHAEQPNQCQGKQRSLDALLEQSPHLLHKYLCEVYRDLTNPY